MPFWPYAPAAAIVFMLFVFGVLGYFPDTQAALLVGAVWIVLLVVAYLLWVKPAAGQDGQGPMTTRLCLYRLIFREALMKTLWQHCHVATMAQGNYSIIEDAAMVTAGSTHPLDRPAQPSADGGLRPGA